MIFDRIENLSLYSFSNEYVNEAIQNILTTPIEEAYSGDQFQKIYLNFNTIDRKEKRFEAHKKFIDIHIVIEGREYIECTHVTSLTNVTEYDEEKDFLLGDTNSFTKLSGFLEKGYALITFPEDAHLVGAHLQSEKIIKKVVFKVPV